MTSVSSSTSGDGMKWWRHHCALSQVSWWKRQGGEKRSGKHTDRHTSPKSTSSKRRQTTTLSDTTWSGDWNKCLANAQTSVSGETSWLKKTGFSTSGLSFGWFIHSFRHSGNVLKNRYYLSLKRVWQRDKGVFLCVLRQQTNDCYSVQSKTNVFSISLINKSAFNVWNGSSHMAQLKLIQDGEYEYIVVSPSHHHKQHDCF